MVSGRSGEARISADCARSVWRQSGRLAVVERPNIDEIMRGEATVRLAEIVASGDEPFLAVDTFREWGSAFRFGVNERGEFLAEALHAHLIAPGRWDEMGSGGSRGSDWETPWRPPRDGWDGEPILQLGSSGLTVEDQAEEEFSLLAHFGFVIERVAGLAISQDGVDRLVRVDSPVGAFVVCTVGRGPAVLTGLDDSGEPVGVSQTFDD
jgi:hypothetical protein